MSLGAVRDILDRLSSSIGPAPVPLSTASARKTGVVIGYKEARVFAADSLSQTARDLKWYFAHASVGSNLLDGMKDLNAGDSADFSYRIESSDGTVPTNPRPGTVYEHNRGNPGWKAKIERFSAAVQNGWRFPTVDGVLNKLCYIDQFASAKSYLRSMCALEARFPETIFVYATMPLTTDADWHSGLRQSFNDEVRDWTKKNNRILFDIADIEAHDENGNPCTFVSGGRAQARLCAEYTDDGGHLNSSGRRFMAQGFYALAAALGTALAKDTKRNNSVVRQGLDIAA